MMQHNDLGRCDDDCGNDMERCRHESCHACDHCGKVHGGMWSLSELCHDGSGMYTFCEDWCHQDQWSHHCTKCECDLCSFCRKGDGVNDVFHYPKKERRHQSKVSKCHRSSGHQITQSRANVGYFDLALR